jgi:hypothetical protein
MCTFQPRLLATPKVSISIRTTLEHSGEPVKPLERTWRAVGRMRKLNQTKSSKYNANLIFTGHAK